MALPLQLPHNKPLVEPVSIQPAGDMRQPAAKPPPQAQLISPHMHGLRTDGEYDEFMRDTKGKTVLVQFGSSWCVKCHEFFPTFYSLSKKYNQLTYAVAQVDYMKERAKGVRFSPTFAFFKNGKKVDEVVGKDAQKLEDHLWLQAD